MSEIDEKEIKLRFESISQFELSPEVTARDLERVRKMLTEQTSGQRTREQKVWRTIMKSPITKLAAAAVIIVTAVLSITILDKSATPAYGITDLPELIKNAKTMHMKGWFYSSQAEQESGEPVKSEFDYWFDIENGRYRLHKPGGIDKDTGKLLYNRLRRPVCDEFSFQSIAKHWSNLEINFFH